MLGRGLKVRLGIYCEEFDTVEAAKQFAIKDPKRLIGVGQAKKFSDQRDNSGAVWA